MNKKLEHTEKSALLAVSGGVDSICLLHLLISSMQKNKPIPHTDLQRHINDFTKLNSLVKLELAYVDHSQRKDTEDDILAIKKTLGVFEDNIPLHIIKLNLEPKCSEDKARKARYEALEKLKKDSALDHIITAHHTDDQIETTLVNLTRGTGTKGLASLNHQEDNIWRPFLWQNKTAQKNLYIFKKDLIEYAKSNKLSWHEDSTNHSLNYFRNRIRKKLDSSEHKFKLNLLKVIQKSTNINNESHELLTNLDKQLQDRQNRYSKTSFNTLPESIQKSFLHLKLSQLGYDVNKKSVQLAKDFINTKNKGKKIQLKGCEIYILDKDTFSFIPTSKK
jgi:tRNA(Ile)-lysidine synthase